jgi:hypothetical protein
VIVLLVSIIILLLLYAFGDNITKFYWEYTGFYVPDIMLIITICCIASITILWCINFCFFIYYSQNKFVEFHKREYILQGIINIIFIGVTIVIAFCFVSLGVNIIIKNINYISLVSRWKSSILLLVTLGIMTTMAYLQLHIIPPANRTAPLHYNVAMKKLRD